MIECCGRYLHKRDKLGRLFCDKCNRLWVSDPDLKMRTIRVMFQNPEFDFATSINGTLAEICKYYNRPIEVGAYPVEKQVKPVAVYFVEQELKVEL